MERKTDRRVQGMTLIEVVFAMSIFSTALLFTLSTLMSTINTNRIMTANATANAAILHQREAVQQVAAADRSTPAAAIVRHFAGLADGNVLPVGPNGGAVPRVQVDKDGRGLLYTFAIPGPAESMNDDKPFGRGFGEMLIYLNEAAVPAAVGEDATDASAATWGDLGNNGGESVGSGEDGYDINGDGKIENGFSGGAQNALMRGDFATFEEEVKPLRLPVDFTVRYFADAAHEEVLYETTRRGVFIGLNEPWNE